MKQYLQAPLPFQGQKRNFAKQIIKVLQQYTDSTVFVDLFGGSGLLSNIIKCQRPDATVVYNDFDNYSRRLYNIPNTNLLLADIRQIVAGIPEDKRINGEQKKLIIDRIEPEEKKHGYVDYITISSSILFSLNYAMSLEELREANLYNCVRKNDYPDCSDYLDGLTITSSDYKEVFNKYKDVPNVTFIVDPPYLNTYVGSYKMNWKLSDYLDVLAVLKGY